MVCVRPCSLAGCAGLYWVAATDQRQNQCAVSPKDMNCLEDTVEGVMANSVKQTTFKHSSYFLNHLFIHFIILFVFFLKPDICGSSIDLFFIKTISAGGNFYSSVNLFCFSSLSYPFALSAAPLPQWSNSKWLTTDWRSKVPAPACCSYHRKWRIMGVFWLEST